MCGEERDVCLNGFVGVGQNLEAVLVVLVCAVGGSVVPRHPAARWREDTRRTGGAHTRRSGGSVRRPGWAEVDGATSTRDLGEDVDGHERRGVVLCCVVLCCVGLGCVVLCCVVLCCVVLCCVVLCCVVLCSVVLCCVVLCCVV